MKAGLLVSKTNVKNTTETQRLNVMVSTKRSSLFDQETCWWFVWKSLILTQILGWTHEPLGVVRSGITRVEKEMSRIVLLADTMKLISKPSR
jgi:hypothetical protein